MELQGSIGTTVNQVSWLAALSCYWKWLTSQIFQGPIEIARVFLQELFEGKVPSKHENKLRLCFKVSKIFPIVLLLCRSTLHLLILRTFWRSQETPWKGTGSLSRRTRRLTRTSWRRATTHAWSTSSHFSGGWSKQLWRKVDCQQIIEWILVVFLFHAEIIFYSPAPCPANQGSAPAARFHSPLSHCKRIKQLARLPQF